MYCFHTKVPVGFDLGWTLDVLIHNFDVWNELKFAMWEEVGKVIVSEVLFAITGGSWEHIKLIYVIAVHIPYILESNPHPFYSFRGRI